MNFFKTEEQKTRLRISKILEICDLPRLLRIENALLTGVVQIDSLTIQESQKVKYQTVESDEVTETTKSTPTQKVNSLTAGTYFVESKNVISMRKELKRLGLSETHTVTKPLA